MPLTLTDEQVKRLLHAYETLMFLEHQFSAQLTKDQEQLFDSAWKSVTCDLLPNYTHDLCTDLHNGGEWASDKDKTTTIWEALK